MSQDFDTLSQVEFRQWLHSYVSGLYSIDSTAVGREVKPALGTLGQGADALIEIFQHTFLIDDLT